MVHTPNLFPLKLLVISLGLALVGAMVTVITAIYVKADHASTSAASCPDATLHLARPGTVTSVTPQGPNVQITLATAQKTLLITVDRCHGTILQTLTIEP